MGCNCFSDNWVSSFFFKFVLESRYQGQRSERGFMEIMKAVKGFQEDEEDDEDDYVKQESSSRQGQLVELILLHCGLSF